MSNTLKYLLFLFGLLCGFQNVGAQQLQIEVVRGLFFKMDKTPDGALKLYNTMAKADLSKTPVLLAYRGASSAAAAGSVSGVWNKLEYFNRGKSELEKAVSLKPNDIEIRFARLATQVNAPGFLGYSGNIGDDKAIIIKTLGSISANDQNVYLYQQICKFMVTQADLNKEEKVAVNQLVVKFNTKSK
ncbi:MAG: hypothetical protein ACOYN4_01305 [Bacteroidales bacterium]